MRPEFAIHAAVFDALLVGKRAAKDLLLDVEPHTAGFALVVRSRDKFVIGTTDSPAACAHVFNDNAGRMIPYIVATSRNRAVLDKAAADLIAFYSAPITASFSDRFNPLRAGARAVLPLLISVFGVAPRNRSGWRVGSAKLLQPAKRDPVQSAVRAFNNLAALSDAVANAAGAPQPPEVVERVAQLLQTVRAPRHFLAA